MLNNDKYREMLIDKYFDNDLDEKEQRDFDKLMKKDKEFNNYVKLERHIRESIDKENINYFRDKILSLEIPPIHKDKSFLRKHHWKFIIGFLLIFGIFDFYVHNNNNNIDDLYDEYYEPSKINIVRGYNENDTNSFKGIVNYYKNNYDESIKDFKKSINQNNNDYHIRFYMALSYMEIGDFDKASYNFSYIISSNNNLYVESSNWYLGLCYLKQNKIEQSIEQFTLISNDDNNYYQLKSNKILKKIKKYEIFKKIY